MIRLNFSKLHAYRYILKYTTFLSFDLLTGQWALRLCIYVLDSPDEFCNSDIFQPRCLKNEVILMKSATYGRMSIGRCITAEEADELGSRYLGCSVDVLPQLDRKCSGKSECDIRVAEISVENVKPCPQSLRFYLEANYDCINGKPSSSICHCIQKRVSDFGVRPMGRRNSWANVA